MNIDLYGLAVMFAVVLLLIAVPLFGLRFSAKRAFCIRRKWTTISEVEVPSREFRPRHMSAADALHVLTIDLSKNRNVICSSRTRLEVSAHWDGYKAIYSGYAGDMASLLGAINWYHIAHRFDSSLSDELRAPDVEIQRRGSQAEFRTSQGSVMVDQNRLNRITVMLSAGVRKQVDIDAGLKLDIDVFQWLMQALLEDQSRSFAELVSRMSLPEG